MKIIFFLIFICFNILAQNEINTFIEKEENTQKELQKFFKEGRTIYENIAPTDEYV